MKFKIETFKEKHPFEFKRWYSPIGRVFDHIENPKERIYETLWLLSTPVGCIRLTATPHIS